MTVQQTASHDITGLAKTLCNDVTVYNLSAGKTLPEFLQDAKKRKKSLRYDEQFRKRLELIQDFDFHSASTAIDISADGHHIMASGCYPPEIRVFDTRELGIKFSRRLDGEIINSKFLSDDFRKIGVLRADRTLEFHAQYGRHTTVRIPHFGRELDYDRATCLMYVSTSSRNILRLDLEEGLFISPMTVSDSFSTVNAISLAPCALPLLIAGGDGGFVEAWDSREDSKPAAQLAVSENVTRLAWAPDAMEFAVGLETGVVRTFDIRSSRVLSEHDHRNDYPIVGLEYQAKNVLGSADRRAVKIWQNREILTAIESKRPLNGLKFWPNSGLLFTPVEDTRIGAYFIPQLGIAPRWCSYLDGLTEELEETSANGGVNSYFEDYVFVSRDQLAQLGGESLIGSGMVRAYLHGFWMDQRLYQKLASVTEPFVLEKHQAAQVSAAVDAARPMRVPVRKSAVGVNSSLHTQLKERLAAESKAKKTSREIATNLLEDRRFAKLWNNADFEIDQA